MNQIFPVFYILMTRRTTECYTALFQFIEKKIFKMEPAEIITDFEGGIRKAIKKCYKRTTLRGCWYHFCAALRKKCYKLGLHSILKSNFDAEKLYQQLMSLPLLPAENFIEGYSYIKKRARENGLWTDFKSFFNYFNSYWLAEVCLKNILDFSLFVYTPGSIN